MAEQNNQILLETKDLQKHFPIKDFFGRKKQAVKAVDGITFQIRKGETFGLVGESGCGKSTLGRTLIRMYEPTGGQIIFDGEDITKLEGAKLQPYHKRMQIISRIRIQLWIRITMWRRLSVNRCPFIPTHQKAILMNRS